MFLYIRVTSFSLRMDHFEVEMGVLTAHTFQCQVTSSVTGPTAAFHRSQSLLLFWGRLWIVLRTFNDALFGAFQSLGNEGLISCFCF